MSQFFQIPSVILDPAGILLPSVLATACSTVVGFLVIKLLQNRRGFTVENYPSDPAPEGESIADGIMGLVEAEETAELTRPTSKWGAALFAGFVFALIAILIGRAIPALNGELSGGEMTRFFLSQWLQAFITRLRWNWLSQARRQTCGRLTATSTVME